MILPCQGGSGCAQALPGEPTLKTLQSGTVPDKDTGLSLKQRFTWVPGSGRKGYMEVLLALVGDPMETGEQDQLDQVE